MQRANRDDTRRAADHATTLTDGTTPTGGIGPTGGAALEDGTSLTEGTPPTCGTTPTGGTTFTGNATPANRTIRADAPSDTGGTGPRPGWLALLLAGMMLSGMGAALGGVAGLAVALAGGVVLGRGAWGLLRHRDRGA